jgi:hypothetical protein
MHYLGAVKKGEGDDALAVAEAMKAAPIYDIFSANGKMRGRPRDLRPLPPEGETDLGLEGPLTILP